jgi:hypothetical protein
MAGHYIEVKKIGRQEEDEHIILIDGREMGISTSYDNAMTVKEWLTTAIADLEKLL